MFAVGRMRSTWSPLSCNRIVISKHGFERARSTQVDPAQASVVVLKDRQDLETIGQKLDIRKLEDWYGITTRQAENCGAGALFFKYGHSLHATLRALIPEHAWQPWMFRYVPRKWASDVQNQRIYLEWAARELGIGTSLDGWYSVRRDVLVKRCGRAILATIYNDSIIKMLQTVYPEHSWDASKFEALSSPRAPWQRIDYRRAFFDEAIRELGLPDPVALSRLPVAEFLRARPIAESLVYRRYKGSLRLALIDTYKEIDWNAIYPELLKPHPDLKRRKYVRKNPELLQYLHLFTNDIAMQRDWLVKSLPKLGLSKIEELRRVPAAKIKAIDEAGDALVRQYRTVPRCLRTVFPEIDWHQLQQADRDFVPRKLAPGEPKLKQFLESIAPQLNVHSLEDWYRVAPKELIKFRGRRVLDLYGQSISSLLQSAYPDHLWEAWRFSSSDSNSVAPNAS